jgi:hypothetical protein
MGKASSFSVLVSSEQSIYCDVCLIYSAVRGREWFHVAQVVTGIVGTYDS